MDTTKWAVTSSGVFALLVGVWFIGSVALAAGTVLSADLNNDQFVDDDDLLIFHRQWHTEGAPLPTPVPGTGVESEILSVEIPPDNRPVVTLRLVDDNGQPIDPTKLYRFRWYIARIIVDDLAKHRTRYDNYIKRRVTGAYGSSDQPTYDQGGEVTSLGDGRFTYRFSRALTGVDRSLTHTVAAQIEHRTVLSPEKTVTTVSNPVFSFVPDGSPVTVTRETSTTETCNSCHNPLALHGGGRRDYTMCLLCHHPGVTDPDTGNSVDMRVMIHKIHRGAALPSVVDGTPYQIIGFGGAVIDYSHVHFPQDIRKCTVCHQGAQGDHYKLVPARDACGACHDNVNFQTGEGHAGGFPQPNDNLCTNCHGSTMNQEFDTSIPGAHLLPKNSTQLAGLNAEILEVRNASPSVAPLVRFRLFNNAGNPIAINTLDAMQATVAGPTVDYATHTTETIYRTGTNNAVDEGNGVYSYQFRKKFAANAQGTYAIALEARTPSRTLKAGKAHTAVRESLANPVAYVAVGGGTATPRRAVIDYNKCNVCHGDLILHGDQRRRAEYCVMCHRPGMTDVARRPAGAMPPETIDFKVMIHKIHMGEELTGPYTVYGFGNVPHDYTEVLFPGDPRACEACHLPGTYQLPAPKGALDTVVTNPDGSEVWRLHPSTAACTACHDSEDALAHALSNTATPGGVEACATCHGPFRTFSVDRSHARD